MHYILIILTVVLFQEVPFKPKDEFDIKLDYQFKQRPQPDHNSVYLAESKNNSRNNNAGVLPYLVLNVTLLKLQEEKMRVQISKNIDNRPVNKKVSANSTLQLDLGFTDDMKDQVSAYRYTISFINAAKETVNKIVISVDKDGAFFVNDEKRGKF
jgi:hypothetical protein